MLKYEIVGEGPYYIKWKWLCFSDYVTEDELSPNEAGFIAVIASYRTLREARAKLKKLEVG